MKAVEYVCVPFHLSQLLFSSHLPSPLPNHENNQWQSIQILQRYWLGLPYWWKWTVGGHMFMMCVLVLSLTTVVEHSKVRWIPFHSILACLTTPTGPPYRTYTCWWPSSSTVVCINISPSSFLSFPFPFPFPSLPLLGPMSMGTLDVTGSCSEWGQYNNPCAWG